MKTSHLCAGPFSVLVLIVTAMWQSESGLDPGKINPERKNVYFLAWVKSIIILHPIRVKAEVPFLLGEIPC